MREKCNALELLPQTGKEVFHLEIGKLLADADSRSMIKGNVIPLVVWLPSFCTLLARNV
jgi:hypothetical protein